MSYTPQAAAHMVAQAYRLHVQITRGHRAAQARAALHRNVPSGILPTYSDVFFSTLGAAGCAGAPAGGGGSEMGPVTGFCGAEVVAPLLTGGGWTPLPAGSGPMPMPGGMCGRGGNPKGGKPIGGKPPIGG